MYSKYVYGGNHYSCRLPPEWAVPALEMLFTPLQSTTAHYDQAYYRIHMRSYYILVLFRVSKCRYLHALYSIPIYLHGGTSIDREVGDEKKTIRVIKKIYFVRRRRDFIYFIWACILTLPCKYVQTYMRVYVKIFKKKSVP